MTLADAMNKSVAAKNISETAAQIVKLINTRKDRRIKILADNLNRAVIAAH